MGKYQRNMSELGPLGIVRETVTICYDNAATLAWIQLTMVLPAMLAIMASGHLLSLANRALDSAPTTPLNVMGLIALYIVVLLINLGISIAFIGALSYTVGCSYTGKSVTYSEILQPLPKVWARLLVTGLWGFLIACLTIFINALVNLGISTFLASKPVIEVPLIALMTLLVLIFCFYFGTILQVANGVTTLEENYGISALSKAEKLLREKWLTALGLFLIYVVPLGALAYADDWAKKYLDWGEHETIKRLSMQVLFLVINSLMTQWSTLSGSVLYVACKAFHHESIVLYISLDHHNLERFSTSPHDSGSSYVEKEDSGYMEPRPSFGRAAFSGLDISDQLDAILARAGPYRPSRSCNSVDELDVIVDMDIPPELTSLKTDSDRAHR